jgi:hypothetical protein
MKQKDFLLILVIVIVSAFVSYFASKLIFVPPKNRQQQVEVVQSISTDFPTPDTKYFNTSAFDPTQPINVTQNTNTNPFTNSAH